MWRTMSVTHAGWIQQLMELITYSFELYLQHGRHDVKCKPSIFLIRFLRVYNHQYSVKLDIGIIRSSGLPVDETRLQYIVSAIGELEDVHPQVSSNKSQESKSTTEYSSDKPQNKNSAALRPRPGDSLKESSSKEAVEVSVKLILYLERQCSNKYRFFSIFLQQL